MDQKNKSKQVWNKLSKLIVKKESFQPFSNPPYNLFLKSHFNDRTQYTLSEHPEFKVILQQEHREVNLQQLKQAGTHDIDNTGTLYWPAEEALAYFCTQNLHLFTKVNAVVELGSGKSALSAITVAMLCPNLRQVIATDGNCDAMCQQNVELNKENLGFDVSISESPTLTALSRVFEIAPLAWTTLLQHQSLGRIAVLISDCLFFEQSSTDLLRTIEFFLQSPESFCLISAPSRGGSRERFVEKALISGLQVEYQELLDEHFIAETATMKQHAQYIEDRHSITFIKILK